MDEKITLHGNAARIDPKKKVEPLYQTNVIVNDVITPRRMPDDRLEYDANFCRDAVDANQK